MPRYILEKPLLTEKMTRLNESLNQVGFIVDKKANKIQIKNAVEAMYGVTVESVNTMIIPGKLKSKLTRTGLLKGKTKTLKKAIITLSEGDEINFFDEV